ncbi:nitrite reductase small subunit NirD [Agrococcus sp. DT81.2]|uniref:nitrite reductase small subunit NirD n=1 Tax=Agrococcus sp. DT81.2 TaxID=3393414 RepID=UPI003CE48386
MTLIADAPVRLSTTSWWRICPISSLHPERGAAAIVRGEQVALFRLHDGSVRAVQQADPYAEGANVMSRGLVGTRGGRPSVASPMFKHVFDLETGECLDPKGEEVRHLRSYPVRVVDGVVEVAA